MLSKSNKVYVQLQPDEETVSKLLSIQARIPPSDRSRLIKPDALHITIIHVGLLDLLIRTIARSSILSDDEILAHIEVFIVELRGIVAPYVDAQFTLTSIGTSLFGINATTYVITFESTTELAQLHSKCLLQLKQLLTNCGISDPVSFMRADHNLQYALRLNPHVTLMKSYKGTAESIPAFNAGFRLMPIVY